MGRWLVLLSCSVLVNLALPACLALRPQDVAFLTALEGPEKAKAAPEFPSSYQVSYNYSLPYTKKIQPHGIRYPVTFFRDHAHHRFRMDTYGGINSLTYKKGHEYVIAPRIDVQRCFVYDMDDEPFLAGSPGSEDGSKALLRALPDLTGWAFQGKSDDLPGAEAELWQYEERHEGKQLTYKFYASADGTPLRLHMYGRELFDGAHFDEWVVDYYDYQPGRPDDSVFETPQLCQGVKPLRVRAPGTRAARSLRMRSLVPAVKYAGDPEYDAFLATHGADRVLSSLPEYRLRAQAYRTNAALIAAHNAAPNRSFSMAMNRFGDWTREEFLTVMLPNHGRPRPATTPTSNGLDHSKYEIPHHPLTDPTRVPRSVDWRGTGADGTAVKDQANCGSCWAFGTTGVMQSAWFMATGERVSFSEQQVMDCSWDWSINKACDGGDVPPGIAYVAASGGVALTQDYEYLGQDAYCRDNSTRRVGKFKGYSRIPRFDNAALMEAIYSRGPVAVSIDASQPGFAFYSGGVYSDPACAYKPDQLDHAVMVVGYGTDEKQGDYWLVKNSWSDLWGDGGYIKISRDNYGCGVPSDATYAVVDGSSAA